MRKDSKAKESTFLLKIVDRSQKINRRKRKAALDWKVQLHPPVKKDSKEEDFNLTFYSDKEAS